MSKTLKTILLSISLLMIVSVACSLGGDVPVEVAVEQTIAARDAVDLKIKQTVDAQLAGQGGGADLADPATGIQPIQPVADPNLASGTPQLRVTLSSVNVRTGPGTNYRPFSALLQNSVVTALAKNQNGSWFLIQLPNGETGWVADSVTDPVVPADMVKVQVAVTIPAPPPPAPPTATTIVTTAAPATQSTATATATTAAQPPAAQPIPSTIVIANNSGEAICEVFIDISGSPSTGDILPMLNLPDGVSQSFPFPDEGLYDMKVIACSGSESDNQAFVSGGPFTWNIMPFGTPLTTITVINNGTVDVCVVNIALSSDPNWTGGNRLAPGFTLVSGDQFSVSVPVGLYDLEASDCNPVVIASLSQQNISSPFTWSIP